MVDLNSEEEYKKLYATWLITFTKLILELEGQGQEIVPVAMSRKMPRLIEWMKKDSTDSFLHNLQFVSEHVLPYTLRHFDPKKQSMVIVDDAIYYGSTINLITGYIREIASIKPYVCPIAVSDVIDELPHAEMRRQEENVIKENNIPYFTTQNAKNIISLSRPIDVEFPILRFDISGANKFEEELDKALEECFENADVYMIEHQMEIDNRWEVIRSYNILPKKGTTYDRWNKDFCKMRVFVSKQEIQVVAYAPGFLSEKALSADQLLFSDSRVQDLWTGIKTSEMAELPEIEGVNSFAKRIRETYEIQCARSKIVWANYLASFLYLLEQKDSLCKAISKVYGKSVILSPKIHREDLQLLLPSELVCSVTTSLNSYFKEGPAVGSTFYGIHSETLANQELIPEECENEYLERKRKGLQRCSVANEALSHIFSNQHFYINDGKLGNNYLQRTQRLRFGITYTALEKNLAFPIGINGLWKSIHQWIDKNIDEGTVKPKYERMMLDGNAYWLRMFRAGENEDSFTKMRRLCEFIIGKIRQKEYRSYVERRVVEDLLALVWEDPCSIITNSYKWDSFEVIENRPAFSLTYRIGKDKRNFLDFLINQGFLRLIQDSAGISRLSTIDENIVVTPLTADQEQAISDYVDAYYFYKEICDQYYIMNNFFHLTDFKKELQTLIGWCNDFSEFMGNVLLMEDTQDIQSKDFENHDKVLNSIIQSVVIADIGGGDQENENRRIIRTWLQKEDSEERTQLRHKLLVALVVKDIFCQLFLKAESEEEKSTIEALDFYLNYLKDEENSQTVIMDLLKMNDKDPNRKEKQKEVIRALQNIIQK